MLIRLVLQVYLGLNTLEFSMFSSLLLIIESDNKRPEVQLAAYPS